MVDGLHLWPPLDHLFGGVVVCMSAAVVHSSNILQKVRTWSDQTQILA